MRLQEMILNEYLMCKMFSIIADIIYQTRTIEVSFLISPIRDFPLSEKG
jgi:hypothetical protein